MPTHEQEILDLKEIVADLRLENAALSRICTDQSRMIRQYRDEADRAQERG